MSITKKMILLLTAILLISCKPTEQRPRLVILISVDQLAYHAYTHYLPVFTGGFKWLNEHGISFDKAYHEHGYTATGPGHFVLGSGLFPGPANILGNYWYDRQNHHDVYCVDDPDANALEIPAKPVSYRQVNGSTFGDWLKAASPGSKVYSVACKDRASIMMGGKHPDLAVWYNRQGEFTTTDYYTDAIPAWLVNFNKHNHLDSYRDSVWTKSLPEAVYAEYAHADSFYGETDRYLKEPYSPVFPIGFEPQWDDQKFYNEMASRPWMDRITLELASAAIKAGELGQDDQPDALAIGLSVFDLLGHYYGPYSQESMDHLIKLDQYLDAFLKRLDDQVGLENVIIALTADHGDLPLPEHWTQIMGQPGGRVDEPVYLATRAKAYAVLDSMYGNHDFIHRKGSSYYYDPVLMDSLDVNHAAVDSILQHYMESITGVYRLYTRTELLNPDSNDYRMVRLSHFMHPTLSPDLYTLEAEGWIFRNPFGTTHGTPYEYDSHVPLVFSSAAFPARAVMDSVATVDIAPTLGAILGVTPTNKVDGVSLRSLLTPD